MGRIIMDSGKSCKDNAREHDHISTDFNAFTTTSGAMSHIPILDPEEEEKLDPHELSSVLIKRAKLAQKSKVSVNDQYKIDYQEMLNEAQDGKIEFPVTRAELDHRASIFTLRAAKMGAATRDLGAGMVSSVASVASTATGTAAAGFQHSLASVGSAASGAAAGVTQGVKHVAAGAGHVATDAATGAAQAATGAITGAMHAAAGAVHAATHPPNAPQISIQGVATSPRMPSLAEDGTEEDLGMHMEVPVEPVTERDDGF